MILAYPDPGPRRLWCTYHREIGLKVNRFGEAVSVISTFQTF